MTGDTILIKDISINGKTLTKTKLSETLTDNTINALGIDASSRTIWINGQPYGNAYVNINEDYFIDLCIVLSEMMKVRLLMTDEEMGLTNINC